MFAYELYTFNKRKGYEFIGVLPERRKNPTRITMDSIMNWGKSLLGDQVDSKDMFFKRIAIVAFRQHSLGWSIFHQREGQSQQEWQIQKQWRRILFWTSSSNRDSPILPQIKRFQFKIKNEYGRKSFYTFEEEIENFCEKTLHCYVFSK